MADCVSPPSKRGRFDIESLMRESLAAKALSISVIIAIKMKYTNDTCIPLELSYASLMGGESGTTMFTSKDRFENMTNMINRVLELCKNHRTADRYTVGLIVATVSNCVMRKLCLARANYLDVVDDFGYELLKGEEHCKEHLSGTNVDRCTSCEVLRAREYLRKNFPERQLDIKIVPTFAHFKLREKIEYTREDDEKGCETHDDDLRVQSIYSDSNFDNCSTDDRDDSSDSDSEDDHCDSDSDSDYATTVYGYINH